MGMSVCLAGASVGSPPRMTHTAAHLEEVAVFPPDGARQVVERTNLPGRLDPLLIRHGKGQPCRIVAPVLQVAQAVHQDLDATLLFAYITNDPAHNAPPRPGAQALRDTKVLGQDPKRRQREVKRVPLGPWEARCPRRRRRDLSPPLRPPVGRDAPPEYLD